MTSTIFYSWQSDLPNATNRGFIQKALERAAKSISDDTSVEIDPVIDRDTVGVPGSPDITSTILAKIEQAVVFVCDVSIINPTSQTRPTPNPNVLIELGYALRALGDKNIILIINEAFGPPEKLPFDLRMKRVVKYNMSIETNDRASERNKLTAMLEESLRTIIHHRDRQLPGELVQPIPIEIRTLTSIDDIEVLDQQLAYDEARSTLLEGEMGKKAADDEFNRFCVELEFKVVKLNERSTHIQLSYRRNGRECVIRGKAISLISTWAPQNLTNLNGAHLSILLRKAKYDMGGEHEDIHRVEYEFDLGSNREFGWRITGQKDIYKSEYLVEDWIRRMLHEIGITTRHHG